MINLEDFSAHLSWAEGRRSYPYVDSVGKTSIGVGRNLDDKGLRESEIDFLLENDIAEALDEAEKLSYWDDLDNVRQLIVADMVFNMGLPRFKGFINTNQALREGDYKKAAEEMKDSKWFRQTGRRAFRLVAAMKTGIWK